MRITPRHRWCMTWVACIILLSAATAAAGNIHGRIEIQPPDEPKISGDWIRVLLISDALQAPDPGNIDGLSPLARMDRVISAHTEFYKRFQQNLERPGFLISTMLTTDTGDFKFVAVAPGRYFVLVTFPSTIGGYKVAWQLPVTVPTDGDAQVDLNWDNMALPTQKR